MLYAIKADEAVVYVDCTDNLEEEYAWHERNYLESHSRAETAPDDFYFMLGYWKDVEHKKIKMVELDVGDKDEEVVKQIIVRALKPIGNVINWEVHWGE